MRVLILLTILLQTSLTPLNGQSGPVEALQKFNEEYPQDKVFFWYNKKAYIAGETIFFKAYVYTGYQLLDIPTTLYAELYNSDRKIITTQLLPVYYGSTQGSFELDKSLPEGVYYVRAYTRWMLNFDESFNYVYALPVYNPASAKQLVSKKSEWKAGAFPEGGNLVNGLETKVAVRLFSAGLLPEKWTGYLYQEDEPQTKINEFSSLDKNAALFSFIPETGKKYLVYVTDLNGHSQICPLPLVRSTGVAISIESENDSITYKLRFKGIPGNGEGYSILGNIQHQPTYFARFKKTDSVITFKIHAGDNMNGILHLTVFDPGNKPVAERLVFINHPHLNYDSTALHSFEADFTPRAGNEIIFSVDSVNWTSYAVSVTDADHDNSAAGENILSSLWLTSDLMNPVHEPAGYFRNPDKNKITALDAIMISEKWNRFSWNEILNNRYPAIRYSQENFLSFKGTVMKGKKLRALEEVNLILSYSDSSFQIMSGKTDSAGILEFRNLGFYGDLKVNYQLNSARQAARSIDIEFERISNFVPYQKQFPESPFNLKEATAKDSVPGWVNRSLSTLKMEKMIDERYKTLKELIITSRLKTAKEELNDRLSSGLFRSPNEIIFDFINENQNAISFTNILDWLRGRIPSFHTQVNNYGVVIPYIRNSVASIAIDEMRADPEMLALIPISDIAMIKVIRGFVTGLPFGGGGGVIAVYTRRGDLRPAQVTSSLPGNTIKGYDIPKKFFSPDYNDKNIPRPGTDFRDQLIWETSLYPNESAEKSTLSFFNNDSIRRFKILIQGFTENGLPVFFEKIIETDLKPF